MMFSLPAGKMESFMASMREGQDKGFAYRGHHMLLRPDFPQPEFYKNMFRNWGLEVKD
jgi:hypothetical protein